jgi:hypothetical protein
LVSAKRVIDRQKRLRDSPTFPYRRWPPRGGGQRREKAIAERKRKGECAPPLLAFNHRPTGIKPDGGDHVLLPSAEGGSCSA